MTHEASRLSQRVTTVGVAVGVGLFVLGVFGQLAVVSHVQNAQLPSGPVSVDLEVLGAFIGCCSVAGGRYVTATTGLGRGQFTVDVDSLDPPGTVYVTRPLAELLLELARDADPNRLTVDLSVTPAADLDGLDDADIPGETPVLTHFYMPETAQSTRSVFGIDLALPLGRTQGRFLSHPLSELSVSKRDDLHGIVLVAVPPWDETSLAAFDRAGRRYPLEILDVTTPVESVPE